MRILTRYILLDLLKVFSLTLTIMTALVFLVLVGREAVENGLGLVPLMRLLPYMLPQAMQFAVPGTMLLATTTVYGRVAASNEIMAVKSLGISPLSLIWPTLILATLISFGTVILNDVAVSWGRGGVQKVILESLEEIIYGRLRTTKSFSNSQLKLTVRRVEDRRLLKPTFFFFASSDEPAWTLMADEAKIIADPAAERVVLELLNAEIDFGGKGSASHPGVWELPISLADFSGRSGKGRSPSTYSLREIGPAKVSQTKEIALLEQEMTAEASYAMMSGRMFELAQDVWQEKKQELQNTTNMLHRLYTEPHRRWANGFSCLCFMMIGAPMAIRRKHGEFWGSFFACFLPILLIYYPMLVGCVDQAKNGGLPPQAVWLGNLVLALWGVWLLRRVVRF